MITAPWRFLPLILCLSPLGACLSPLRAATPMVFELWPEGVPGQITPDPSPKTNPNVVTNISAPTLTVYRPEKPNGTAVIVAPGGGFMFLSIVHEGRQVCEWLNTLGITAGLLTYRTPTRSEAAPFAKPVEDAQRALGLLRHHAEEWQLHRFGLLGFSAGGNLIGHAAFDRSPRSFPQNPQFDHPALPDFLVMIYGGGFLDPADSSQFRPNFSVPPDAPPAFFLVAHDDKNNPLEAIRLYLEYQRQKRPAELHIFTHGGHGFGMRADGHPINQWPARCADWLKSMGF